MRLMSFTLLINTKKDNVELFKCLCVITKTGETYVSLKCFQYLQQIFLKLLTRPMNEKDPVNETVKNWKFCINLILTIAVIVLNIRKYLSICYLHSWTYFESWCFIWFIQTICILNVTMAHLRQQISKYSREIVFSLNLLTCI